VFFSTALLGQEFTGSVKDNSGAVVPGAVITVHDQLTGIETSTKTAGTGDYTVPYLKPGLYSVSAEMAGFQKQVKTDITLEAGRTLSVDFSLEVGAASETVTIKEDRAFLDVDKADRGEVIDNQQVTQLPLDGRETTMLAVLNASVYFFDYNNGSNPGTFRHPANDDASGLSINGGQPGGSEMMMDGVSNDGPGNGYNSSIAPVEAVQEIKLVTSPYDAQYGRGSGGVMDLILKSGTNNIHGSVYEFARRTWLDANQWSYDYAKSQNTPGLSPYQFVMDNYGAELDGPVFLPKIYNGKDKSFFLLQYDNIKERIPGTGVFSVPFPEMLNGDFSNLTYWDGTKQSPVIIYDPLTLSPSCATGGACTRQPFPGNIIPPGRINPAAKAILSYFPKPNSTALPGTNPTAGDYVASTPSTNKYRNMLAKWDQKLSTADRLSLRWGLWESFNQADFNGIPGSAGYGLEPQVVRDNTFTADWIHPFSPSLVLDVKASASVRTDYISYTQAGFDLTSLGWSQSLVSQLAGTGDQFPSANFANYDGLGSYYGRSGGQVNNAGAFFPRLTWIKGKHTLHAGFDMRLHQLNQKDTGSCYTSPYCNGDGATFFTDPMWTSDSIIDQAGSPGTGDDIASFLLGTPNSGSVGVARNYFLSWHYYAPFVQDDWKVTPKLTLNLGVRWDFTGPITERRNELNDAFDTTSINPINSITSLPNGQPILGGMTFAGVNGNPRSPYPMVKTNIQPRVGFAYSLDSKTVLRGGFGEMFVDSEPTVPPLGFSSLTQFAASLDKNKTPYALISNPYPEGLVPILGSSQGLETDLGQGLTGFVSSKYKIPSYWTYSFGFERQLATHDTLDMSYVGSRTYNLGGSYNLNPVAKAYVQQCNLDLGPNNVPATCDNDYPNSPFYGVSAFQGSGYDINPQIWGGNLTRPLPAFQDITETRNLGRSWFNSLQVTVLHKWSNSLSLHGTWNWSKTMDAGNWADQVNGIRSRTLDFQDMTHKVTISGVYLLPVGRGRKFMGNANRLVDGAIGGWELASAYLFYSGAPVGLPGGMNELHSGYVKRHNETPLTIRGIAPCITQWQQDDNGNWSKQPVPYTNSYTGSCAQSDFEIQPEYAINNNVVYTGIRVPPTWLWDANLSKNFAIVEKVKLQFRLEAFNVLNHPEFGNNAWGNSYDTSNQDDPMFGVIQKIYGQSNQPREVQLGLKLTW
jgi:hypothetical protein